MARQTYLKERPTLKGFIFKTKKINKGEYCSKKAAPTTFYNRKHLRGWAKIPIPKQIVDEHIEKIEENKCPRNRQYVTLNFGHILHMNIRVSLKFNLYKLVCIFTSI